MPGDDFMFSVNTLVGCNYDILKQLEKRFRVEEPYLRKYRGTKRLSRLLTALSYFDRMRYRALSKNMEIRKPPVYVLGHWRTGTTLMLSLLCSSKYVSYPTTYQTVFPNNLFFLNGFLKSVMQYFLPEKRLVDHVKMHVDYPQEEDFALGNEAGFSFYYWFYFPRDWKVFSDHFLDLSSGEEKTRRMYASRYIRFIKRCMLNVGGEQYIAKNPPNMARIPFLLDLFPGSRFVTMRRNPYEVLTSTFRFYKGFLRTLQLQDFDDPSLWDFIFHNYKYLHRRYLRDKALIPPDQLVEISYEQLTEDPEGTLNMLLDEMLSDLEPDRDKLDPLLARHRDHTFKKYEYEPAFIERVNRELGDLIPMQGYQVL